MKISVAFGLETFHCYFITSIHTKEKIEYLIICNLKQNTGKLKTMYQINTKTS